MERLKRIKDNLIYIVEQQLSNLDHVETKELGEVVDMIKDIDEALYYCTIVKSMEANEYQQGQYGYTEPMMWDNRMNGDWSDRGHRMYYGGNGGGNSSSSSNGGNSSSTSGSGNYDYQSSMMNNHYPSEIRDYREGRSPMIRRSYMEAKEQHHGQDKQMKELEKYMQELSQDVTDMIGGASMEEKQMLQNKLRMLADKVSN